jgi:hypothetical protein
VRGVRKLAPSLFALSLLAAACGGDAGPQPNVLFVVVDDLNCDVACYGAPGLAEVIARLSALLRERH